MAIGPFDQHVPRSAAPWSPAHEDPHGLPLPIPPVFGVVPVSHQASPRRSRVLTTKVTKSRRCIHRFRRLRRWGDATEAFLLVRRGVARLLFRRTIFVIVEGAVMAEPMSDLAFRVLGAFTHNGTSHMGVRSEGIAEMLGERVEAVQTVIGSFPESWFVPRPFLGHRQGVDRSRPSALACEAWRVERDRRKGEAAQAAQILAEFRETRSHNRRTSRFTTVALVIALGSLGISLRTCIRQDRTERRSDRPPTTRPASP